MKNQLGLINLKHLQKTAGGFNDYLKIIDKYGKIMFETKNSTEGWNGISYGQKQPMDVYAWIAEGIDNNGNKIQKNGNVLLIR